MSKNKKLLLVVNPISGGIDKAEIINFLQNKCEQEDRELSIYYTIGNTDEKPLREMIGNLQPERVIVIGGDGTIKLLAGIIKETSLPIGLLPAGSANGLAENLNLPPDLEGQVDIALGTHYVKLDCINVNGELCLHISDIGLNAELIKSYQEGNIRGKLGYLLHSIPTLIKSDFPFHFTIIIDGQVYQREGFLLAVANARKYGTGATINPGGKFNDGLFEVLLFKKFNIPQILKTFQEDVILSEDFLEIFPAKKASIKTTKPLPFQVDGEYFGEVQSVEAHVSTLKVRMAVPKDLAEN